MRFLPMLPRRLLRLPTREALVAVALASSGASRAQTLTVTLGKPARDFGVFVGDLLTSTAFIDIPPGAVLDPRSLPQDGPVSPIVDIRRVSVGGTPARLEIRVTYQSFFSPEQVLGADVPGYTIAFTDAGKRLSATVPGFGFTASTFRHDLQPTLDPASLRPDYAPRPASAPDAAWEVAAGFVAMVGGVLALAWPRPFARRRTPFTVAARELARLTRASGDEDDGDAARRAMLVLHRAFDATAGRRVFADDLDEFVRLHRGFQPLRASIGMFFDASRAVFFGGTGEPPAVASWTSFCRELVGAERVP